MRLLIQRVNAASVTVGKKKVSHIDRGILLLCGFHKSDTIGNIPKMAEKCLNLRVFEDAEGKMNLSLMEINGSLLVVSQFTLYADCRKGRRPSFDSSMPPDDAQRLYNALIAEFRKSGLNVAKGIFGAKMEVELVNDGPVTIMLDNDAFQESR